MRKEQWMHNEIEDLWMNCETFNTKQEAIEAGREEYKGERTHFFVGRQEKISYTPSVDVGRILEDISENVYDEVGEAAGDYLDDVREKDHSELEEKMNAVLSDWMKAHKYEPNYYLVINIEEVSEEK
ncbi:hypothetical protein [Sporosarcina sp. FSL W7-1283]|uniref:hypothetical protein n=1 Tax=Sporosarcina sp. FSL W7-1283 TaxID=2921560 RepID=UPI0030FC9B71